MFRNFKNLILSASEIGKRLDSEKEEIRIRIFGRSPARIRIQKTDQ